MTSRLPTISPLELLFYILVPLFSALIWIPLFILAAIETSDSFHPTPSAPGRASLFFYNFSGVIISHVSFWIWLYGPSGWDIRGLFKTVDGYSVSMVLRLVLWGIQSSVWTACELASTTRPGWCPLMTRTTRALKLAKIVLGWFSFASSSIVAVYGIIHWLDTKYFRTARETRSRRRPVEALCQRIERDASHGTFSFVGSHCPGGECWFDKMKDRTDIIRNCNGSTCSSDTFGEDESSSI